LVSACIILASFSYGLVILCNIMIYRKLSGLKMSKKSREIQAQLSKVLQYQVRLFVMQKNGSPNDFKSYKKLGKFVIDHKYANFEHNIVCS
jgi:hypothetical protein